MIMRPRHEKCQEETWRAFETERRLFGKRVAVSAYPSTCSASTAAQRT